MNTTIELLKSILLPKFEQDIAFSIKTITPKFWEEISNDFVNYEQDIIPLQNSMKSIGLKAPENIISNLPELHQEFISQLAEDYVLGKQNETLQYLVNNEHQAFKKEVDFLKSMNQAIKKVERTNLRNQFEQWDKELSLEEIKGTPKVFPILWIKFAVAAMLVLSVGVYVNSNLFNKQTIELAQVDEKSFSVDVLSNEVLGFGNADTQNKISITIVNHHNRIMSLEKVLEKDNSYIEEFNTLKRKNLHYFSKENVLTIYFNEIITKVKFIKTVSGKKYVCLNNVYYTIDKIDKELRPLSKEKNKEVLEELEKIIFNE